MQLYYLCVTFIDPSSVSRWLILVKSRLPCFFHFYIGNEEKLSSKGNFVAPHVLKAEARFVRFLASEAACWITSVLLTIRQKSLYHYSNQDFAIHSFNIFYPFILIISHWACKCSQYRQIWLVNSLAVHEYRKMVICGTHVFGLIPTSPPSLSIPDWKKKHEFSQFSEMTNSPLCNITFV